ncbi:MAG: hypothetical protein U9P42_02615 [Candidatus Fermentibacteria bacterium]|nr:hypothetical protein [Candidatus Fermentibacteria bacterium]
MSRWKSTKHFSLRLGLGPGTNVSEGKVLSKKTKITATVHKLARLIYSLLENGTEYVDQEQDHYEKEYQGRVLKNMKRKAVDMGLPLIPVQNNENVSLDGVVC